MPAGADGPVASCSSVLREIWTVAFAWDEGLRIQPEDHHQIELKSISVIYYEVYILMLRRL